MLLFTVLILVLKSPLKSNTTADKSFTTRFTLFILLSNPNLLLFQYISFPEPYNLFDLLLGTAENVNPSFTSKMPDISVLLSSICFFVVLYKIPSSCE